VVALGRVRSCADVYQCCLSSHGLLELLTLQLAICPARIVCARIVGTLFWRNAVLVHESNDSRKITDCEVGPR
jgi:hypothetical protein